MKTAYTLAAIVFIVLCLTGCGHNVVVHSKGLGIETTLNPETFTFGVCVRYGDITTIAIKEKSSVSLESGLKQEASSGMDKSVGTTTGLDTKLSIMTGDQITGYTVELEKIKALKTVVK
jgi:hypothetical protein